MTDLRKAAELALEALEEIDGCPRGVDQATIPKAGIEAAPKQVVFNMSIGLLRLRKAQKAIEALRQALAEPVMYIDGKRLTQGVPDWKPGMVYPKPKCEWVGLSEEEKCDVLEDATGDGGHVYYDTLFRTIEAKLKEKNT